MMKKTIAAIVLGFIVVSLALPIPLSEIKDEEEEIVTISQYEPVAGLSVTKEVEKCITDNKKDFELICRTVYCEAGNQDIKTQEMVALTIMNRVKSKRFPNTVKGVVYQKNAYAVTNWKDFSSRKWTKQVEKAVKRAAKSKKHPKDMFYFRTDYFHKFGKPYMVSGDLWFSTER